jgi:hypothetical protein
MSSNSSAQPDVGRLTGKAAVITGGAHAFVEELGAFERGDGVAGAVEDEGGREAGANVVTGGEFFPALADSRVAVAFGGGVDDRIEEDEGVGKRGDGEVVGGFVDRVEEGGAGGDVAACGVAGDDDAVGIDAEFAGVLTEVADRGSPVFDAIEDGRALRVFEEAVVDADTDHAELGEVVREGEFDASGAASPTAAVDGDPGGALVGGLVAVGFEDVEVEIAAGDGFVDDGTGGLELFGDGGEGTEGCGGKGRQPR